MVLVKKSLRRKKNYWSKNETDILKEAVSQYGKKWSKIEKMYPIFNENGRTQIDLKDKWRNLNKNNKIILLDAGDYETLNYIISRKEKRKSPNGSRRKSPNGSRRKSPKKKSKSPNGSRRKSPKKKYKSPNGSRRKYPNGSRRKSPKKKSKSPNGSRRKSPKVSKRKTEYIIYSKEGCPYCISAKELLKSNRINFKEIKVTDSNIKKIYKKIDTKTNNYRYFPIIFKNNVFIGGFSDLDKNNL
jgi:glutaredoxin 3